jgi:hypothetical protein
MDTIPFTYLLGWTEHDMWYYGVKYAEGCSPDDLWTTYYTSSTYVKDFRAIYGEPDIIKIRKIFKSQKSAIDWEDGVIRRGRLYEDSRYLNKAYSGSIFYDDVVRKKMSDHAKLPRSQDFKNARSKSMLKSWRDGVYDNRPEMTDEHKLNMSKVLKEKYQNTQHHCSGNKLSEEHKKNISKGVQSSTKYQTAKEQKKFVRIGKDNGMYNKNQSDESKNKIREKALARPKLPCPKCGVLATKQVLARYHKECLK